MLPIYAFSTPISSYLVKGKVCAGETFLARKKIQSEENGV